MDEQNGNAAGPQVYTQARRNEGALANHPQRENVIDAILKGESSLSISGWITPKVSRVTIGILARQVKEQAQTARVALEVSKVKELGLTSGVNHGEVERFTKAAVLGSQHLERIAKHQARLDVALADAESASDIATLIKTDLQGVRLAAELDGSLAQAGPQTGNTYNVVILPPPGQQLAGEVIDAEFTDESSHDK